MKGTGREGEAECGELFARLSEYLDQELDPALCAAIESHLSGCADCEAFVESLRRTIALLRRVPALPPEERERIREALRKSAADHEQRRG